MGNKDGNQNVRFNVLEATKTELKCMTDPNIAGLEGPQVVYAMIDLEFIANCVDDCEFKFSKADTPVIYQASSQVIKPGEHIALNGTLFKETVQVSFDDFPAEIVSLTSNQMVVRVPEIISKGNIILTATDPIVGNYLVNSSISFNSMLEIFVECQVKTVKAFEINCKNVSVLSYGNDITISQNNNNLRKVCYNCFDKLSLITPTPSVNSLTTNILNDSVQVKKLEIG